MMTSAASDALVIQNPATGTRRPERLRARIAAQFARLGRRADICTTTGAGAAYELARRAIAEGLPRVVVAGGDGTVSEAAGAVQGTSVVLGVIPCGTGNQLAYNLGIPTALDRAVATAMGDSIQTIDVGVIERRTFLAMAGAGIDAAVIAGARPNVKRWAGGLAYVLSGFAAAVRPRRSRLKVRVDGLEWEGDGIGVLIANVPALRVPLVPRGLTVAPNGSAEDGTLDCCALAITHLSELAVELWHALLGRAGGREGHGIRRLSGTTVELDADPPLPVQVDGDLAGTTPLRATILPAALRVAVPPAVLVAGRSPG